MGASPLTMSCPSHQSPTFGCSDCINSDRTAAEKQAIADWKKTYKPPKCRECGSKMVVWDDEPQHVNGKLVVEVLCQSMNTEEGYFECDNSLLVEIP